MSHWPEAIPNNTREHLDLGLELAGGVLGTSDIFDPRIAHLVGVVGTAHRLGYQGNVLIASVVQGAHDDTTDCTERLVSAGVPRLAAAGARAMLIDEFKGYAVIHARTKISPIGHAAKYADCAQTFSELLVTQPANAEDQEQRIIRSMRLLDMLGHLKKQLPFPNFIATWEAEQTYPVL